MMPRSFTEAERALVELQLEQELGVRLSPSAAFEHDALCGTLPPTTRLRPEQESAVYLQAAIKQLGFAIECEPDEDFKMDLRGMVAEIRVALRERMP